MIPLRCRFALLILVALPVGCTSRPMARNAMVFDDRLQRVVLLSPGTDLEEQLKSAVRRANAGEVDVIRFAPGEFRMPGGLEFQRKLKQGGLRITGHGPGITRLVFSTSQIAIKVQLDTDIHQAATSPSFVLEELSLLASGQCGTAVEVSRGDTSLKGGTSAKQFSNLTIEGMGGQWQTGINVRDLAFCSFRDITIRLPREGTTGISISGSTAPVDHHLSGIRIMGSSTGIHVGGDVEGVYIDQTTMIGVGIGVDWNTDGHEPLLALIGSHISARTACVRANHLLQPIITANLLYQADPEVPWTGIDIRTTRPTGYDLLQISNNTLHGDPLHTVPNTGISVEAGSAGVLNGDLFSCVDTGIRLGKNAKNLEPKNCVFRQTKAEVERTP